MGFVSNLVGIWRCFAYEKDEISAWMKTVCARGPETVVVSLFTSSALLFLADQLDDDCDGSVDIGITLKISSVLSATQVGENVLNLIMSPFWGALADAKSNRKSLLVFSSLTWVGMVGLGGVLLFFKPTLGLLYAFIFTVLMTAVFYELALLLAFAYLPEIVDNEKELNSVTSKQYAIVNALQFGAAGFLVAITFFLPDDDNELLLPIMAHFLVVVIWCYLAVPGLIKLPSRSKKLTDGTDAKSKSALRELYRNIVLVYKKYPNVGYFLLAWMFYFAGVASVTVLQVAYVTEEFDYSTTEVSYLGGTVLVFSVVGALLAGHLSKRYKMKTLLLVAILAWSIVCFAAPFLLRGELRDEIVFDNDTASCGEGPTVLDRQPTFYGQIFAFVFAAIVGIGVGFVYPVNTSIYAMIIPGGDEATFFGLKTFCAKVVSWAPPLVFTVINERTDNLQFAFMSLGLWFAVSVPFVLLMNVEQGIEDVKDTLHLRQGAGAHNFNVEEELAKKGFDEMSHPSMASVKENLDELDEEDNVPAPAKDTADAKPEHSL